MRLFGIYISPFADEELYQIRMPLQCREHQRCPPLFVPYVDICTMLYYFFGLLCIAARYCIKQVIVYACIGDKGRNDSRRQYRKKKKK